MIASEAHVPTSRATRYLTQLAQHLEHLRDRPHSHSAGQNRPAVTAVERSDSDAAITFAWGALRMHADADALTLRLQANDVEQLHRLQALIAHRLETISRRDPLRITWQDHTSALTRSSAESGCASVDAFLRKR